MTQLSARKAAQARETHTRTSPGMRSDVTLTAIAVVLIAIAGGVLWFVLADSGSPRVVFDGQRATYDGPAAVEVGSVTFDFVNESGKEGAFVVSRITDDTLTVADLKSYATDARATVVPPWVGTYKVNIIQPGETGEREMMLHEGRWWLTVHTAPDDTNEIVPAGVLLEVKAK